jgi:hypothetical protein
MVVTAATRAADAVQEHLAAEAVSEPEESQDVVVPSKRRQIITAVSVPIKRTLRSAATPIPAIDTSPTTATESVTTITESNGSSSVQPPSVGSFSLVVPGSSIRATSPPQAAVAASTTVNNRGDTKMPCYVVLAVTSLRRKEEKKTKEKVDIGNLYRSGSFAVVLGKGEKDVMV